jgi:hypothetical protein
MKEPCMCGAIDCRICGPLQGYPAPGRCRYCNRFFDTFKCSGADECDCPRCSGLCECERYGDRDEDVHDDEIHGVDEEEDE